MVQRIRILEGNVREIVITRYENEIPNPSHINYQSANQYSMINEKHRKKLMKSFLICSVKISCSFLYIFFPVRLILTLLTRFQIIFIFFCHFKRNEKTNTEMRNIKYIKYIFKKKKRN